MYLKEYLSHCKVKSQREEKLSRSDVAGRIVDIGQLPSFSAALFPYHSNFLSNRGWMRKEKTVQEEGAGGRRKGGGREDRQGTGKWMRNRVCSLRLSFTCQYLFALPVERRLLIQPKSN